MKLLFGFALWFVGGLAPVLAHDIGVSQAELTEHQPGQYELKVRTGAAPASVFPPPFLPAHCVFASSPRGVQQGAWRVFEFACPEGLTANDSLDLSWRRDGIMLKAVWANASEAKALFRAEAGHIVVPMAELQAGSGSFLGAAQRYTGLGIEHILLGFDHLLFVLALLLIVSSAWTLVKTITAFTVAHSITLGLATLGFINMPTRPVEATIALSIVFLCVEIVHARQGRIGMTYRFPWLVAFAFGLLHGLGFAGALSEIDLPQGEIPVALLFFNVGVEVGQLIFVLAVLLLHWFIGRFHVTWPKPITMLPVYLIGTAATYWLLQRIGVIVVPS